MSLFKGRRPADDTIEPGQTLHQMWVAAVRQHHPGDPNPRLVAPWADLTERRRTAAAAIERLIQDFATLAGPAVMQLGPQQRGRFLALCWIGQAHRAAGSPDDDDIADWDDLPPWRRRAYIATFDSVTEAHRHLPQQPPLPSEGPGRPKPSRPGKPGGGQPGGGEPGDDPGAGGATPKGTGASDAGGEVAA